MTSMGETDNKLIHAFGALAELGQDSVRRRHSGASDGWCESESGDRHGAKHPTGSGARSHSG